MAVALEVCKILHKAGELDDHLLPVGKESAAKVLEYLIGDDDDEIWPEDGRARPGSTKRKQYYRKKVPYCRFFSVAHPLTSKGGIFIRSPTFSWTPSPRLMLNVICTLLT